MTEISSRRRYLIIDDRPDYVASRCLNSGPHHMPWRPALGLGRVDQHFDKGTNSRVGTAALGPNHSDVVSFDGKF